VKYATQDCLDLRAVFLNHVFEDGCCQHKEGDREDDAAVYLGEVAGVRIRVEPPYEEDGGVHLDVVFYVREVRWLGFHEAHEDNSVCHMDEENSPEVCRSVQVPEIHH